MTTRLPPNPPKHSEENSDYLIPDSIVGLQIKRNLPTRPGPRIQTMPPSNSEEAVGIYSFLDGDTMDDDYLKQTLEAIESGEFSKVPEEIINWYNSLSLDTEVSKEGPPNEPTKRYYCSDDFELKQPNHEYIDIEEEKFSSFPSEVTEEIPESIKRPKRFQKGERINFIKDRLSQFLTSNFKGIKLSSRREESKRSDTHSNSSYEWNERDNRAATMITSNSFDDSTTSLDYIENPLRRLSTEVFISQLPPFDSKPRRETFRSYLEPNENLTSVSPKLVRQQSKSLENVLVSSQTSRPPAKPLRKYNYDDTGPYLLPAHLPIPSPPPRVSSRHKEIVWNTDLTQEYIEPRAIICEPAPRSKPSQLANSARERETADSADLYILPKDTPPTPMPRFVHTNTTNNSVSSIPVISSGSDYNDPLDFGVSAPEGKNSDPKPLMPPKPSNPHSYISGSESSTKPILAPKPKGLAYKKQKSPGYIYQNSIHPRPHTIDFPQQESLREFKNSN